MRQMAIVIFTIIWLTPSLVFAETKDGFRDMRWGDAPTADFERAEGGPLQKSHLGSSEAVRYKRSSDKLTIGKVDLNGIFYFFEDNKLCEVHVSVNSERLGPGKAADFRVIADALKLAYGAPAKEEISDVGGLSVWSVGNTRIFLIYLEARVDIVNQLMIIDNAYLERVSRDKAAKEQKEKTSAANAGRDDL